MKLNMINVGFGDCFVFHDNEKSTSMMVDFGTRGFRNGKFGTIGKLAEHLKCEYIDKSKNNTAMITHFHVDHYSGFKYLANHYKDLFDTVYIPYVCVEDTGSNRFVLLELAIYYYLLLSKTTYTWQVSQNILKHIETVTKLAKNNNVVCLSNSDSFSYSDRSFEVIWPNREMGFKNSLNEFLNKLDAFAEKIEGLVELKKKLIKNMENWNNCISMDKQSTLDTRKQQIEEIIANQNRYMEQLDAYKNEYGNILAESTAFKDNKHSSTILFSRSNNSTSIVFQDKLELKEHVAMTSKDENKKKELKLILMAGDIEADIVDKCLKDRFYPYKYHVLKAPHHGTYGHYTGNLPLADNIFISTGPRRGYTKICRQYKHHGDVNGIRACTSGRDHCDIAQPLANKCSNGLCYNDSYGIDI